MSRQFAWLDLFDGRWLFLNGNLKYPARSWSDEDAALSDLLEEGWIIIAPHHKRGALRKSKRKASGYMMTRTVH